MGKFLRKISSIIVALALVVSSMSIVTFADEKTKAADSVYLVVNSKTNYMGYYKNGNLVKEFRVSTGKKNTPTPNGKYKIVNKIKDRPYYQGGIPGGSPNNPLGDRWMGLHVGSTYGTTYGVHGNNNENSIGKNITGGCIRMHNKEIRWLFDQISTGAYVIVDNSNLSYTKIASKYGVTLNDPNAITENIKKLESEFNKFATYNSINLKDKNSLITKSEDATKILESKSNYLNAYNKLTSKEKEHTKVKSIHSEYNKIISIVEASQAVLKFYENVTSKANEAIKDLNLATSLNNLDAQDLGMRGRARRELNEAVAVESIEGSKRVSYLNNLYYDSVNFLLIPQSVANEDLKTAQNDFSKIKDQNLKNIAKSAVDNISDIAKHWAKDSINTAMNSGWIDNSKRFRPDDSITRAEFVKIINRAFNFTESEEVTLNDVSKDKWYYSEIAIAMKQGYIDGYDDNTFKPNDNIRREEVAKIITSIMNNIDEEIDKASTYKDFEKISQWALPYVEGAIEAGYMGNGGVEFRPQDNITRAEAVVTIQRTK